jgi:hypothetical protein
MHLSEEAALEVQQMRDQINELKQELEETKANPNLLEARKGANESSSSDESGEYWFTELKPGYYERRKNHATRIWLRTQRVQSCCKRLGC